MKKLRKKLNTDTSSITALKYANHHLNVSFEKTSIQLNNEKNNIKRDKAIRRKERLAKLKNNIDSNLNNIQSLNKMEKQGYIIAKEHLGSSFSLVKSIGFKEWLVKQKELRK